MRVRRTLVLAAFAVCPLASGAQTAAREPLKRALLRAAARPTCEVRPVTAQPSAAQRARARAMAQRGQQAAILGDRASARDELRQAAQLDPTDPDLAYQLARAQEAVGAPDLAVVEYCRFLALAPQAPEANEARERVSTLAKPTTGAVPAANAPLRQGLAAYDAGRLAEAESALGRAIALEPRWADAYYDRGVVRAALGEREGARTDFEQYLRLRPEAEDRSAVVSRVNSLGRLPPSPRQALALGLVLPGAGQFYTGRPVAGLVALGASVGALAYGFQTQTRTVEVTRDATDPFGNPYTYTTTQRISERPHTAIGAGAVVAILIGGGLEAYRYARRTPPGTRLSVHGTGDAIVVSVALR